MPRGRLEEVKGDLHLTNRKAILAGGDTGPAVDLKNPGGSLLLKAIHYKDENYQMPPKGKLADKDIAILEKWVKAGLPVSADRVGGEVVKPKVKAGVVTEEAKKYWAYQPVKRPAVPAGQEHLVRKPDRRLHPGEARGEGAEAGEARGKGRAGSPGVLRPDRPAADAGGDRRVRRPTRRPTPGRSWSTGCSQSPHYGEKWGRHWLDLVRYAETNGYERDGPKPFAWRYRDYVISSFNDDKPYDAVRQGATRRRRDARLQPGRRSSPPATTASASGTTSRPTRSRRCSTATTTSSPPPGRRSSA